MVKGEKYVNEFWNIVRENNALKMVLMGLILIIIIEGFFTVKVMNTQRTIVIPSVKGKYEFTDTYVSHNYLVNMGILLANLIENFTPETVKFNYQRFLSFLSPENYGEAESVLMANAEKYISSNVSSMFTVKNVKIYPHEIDISGYRKLIVASKVVSSQNLKVIIHYEIKNGEFEVVNYEEKQGKNIETH